jgi:glutathione synthase/RimK-type ligase-like ATP-grasp enzyme
MGVAYFYLETDRFPSHYHFNLTINDADQPRASLTQLLGYAGLSTLDLTQVTGVYHRWYKGPQPAPAYDDPKLRELAYWNVESALGSVLRFVSPKATWVNSLEAQKAHSYKPKQLLDLHNAGIPVPKTLVSNNPDTIRVFASQQSEPLIYKPVKGWAEAERLTPNDLTDERLAQLVYCPLTLQTEVVGVEHRIYVVGKEIFPLAIQSSQLDYRGDKNAVRQATTLSQAEVDECLLICKTLGYCHAGIDGKRTPEGKLVYFEANPSPVFVLDSQLTGYPIAEKLLELLH